jgi:hypothetical protein
MFITVVKACTAFVVSVTVSWVARDASVATMSALETLPWPAAAWVAATLA